MKKVKKNNRRVISIQYAHFQTMAETPVKFQRNQYKTVGGVACTSYLVSIHFGWKNDLVHFKKKVTK